MPMPKYQPDLPARRGNDSNSRALDPGEIREIFSWQVCGIVVRAKGRHVAEPPPGVVSCLVMRQDCLQSGYSDECDHYPCRDGENNAY